MYNKRKLVNKNEIMVEDFEKDYHSRTAKENQKIRLDSIPLLKWIA